MIQEMINKIRKKIGNQVISIGPIGEGIGDDIFVVALNTFQAADAFWYECRSNFSQTHVWPVVLGMYEDLECHRLRLSRYSRLEMNQAIAKGMMLTIAEWRGARGIEFYEDFILMSPGVESYCVPGDFPIEIVDYDPIYVALMKVPYPWIVPGMLAFGGWGNSPRIDQHIAYLRELHRLVGAEVFAVTCSGIGLRLEYPPRDLVRVKEIARDLFLYTPDYIAGTKQMREQFYDDLLEMPYWWLFWDCNDPGAFRYEIMPVYSKWGS